MSSRDGNLDAGLLVLRVGLGALLIAGHGWGKLLKILAGDWKFGDPLGIGAAPSLVLAASGEVLFALLVALGVKVRWTAIPPALVMAVAAFVQHAGDPLVTREKALLFLVGYVTLIFTGGGRFGLDTVLARRGARS